jgi:hypothetical protein
MTFPVPELLDLVKALARAAEARDFARSSSGVEHVQNTVPDRRPAAAGRR